MLTHPPGHPPRTSWAPSEDLLGTLRAGPRAADSSPGLRLGEGRTRTGGGLQWPRPNGGRGRNPPPSALSPPSRQPTLRPPVAALGRSRAAARMRRGMVHLRALGIDFGEKRIGIAISDPAGRLAVPLTTLARRDDRSAMAAIAEIALREGVGRLVMGEPVRLDGTRG